MEFSALMQRALEIRERYAALEQARDGTHWTSEEIMLGFAGDVGDLAKLVLAASGRRSIPRVPSTNLPTNSPIASGPSWCWRSSTASTSNALSSTP